MSYLREPGTYAVLIIGAKVGPNKKGDDMLTLTFKEIQGDREICGYYVPKHANMMDALAKLKTAVGVTPFAKKEELLGKKLLIGVRSQRPKPGVEQKINPKTNKPYEPFAEIFNYAPFVDAGEIAKEVFGSDDLPF